MHIWLSFVEEWLDFRRWWKSTQEAGTSQNFEATVKDAKVTSSSVGELAGH